MLISRAEVLTTLDPKNRRISTSLSKSFREAPRRENNDCVVGLAIPEVAAWAVLPEVCRSGNFPASSSSARSISSFPDLFFPTFVILGRAAVLAGAEVGGVAEGTAEVGFFFFFFFLADLKHQR